MNWSDEVKSICEVNSFTNRFISARLVSDSLSFVVILSYNVCVNLPDIRTAGETWGWWTHAVGIKLGQHDAHPQQTPKKPSSHRSQLPLRQTPPQPSVMIFSSLFSPIPCLILLLFSVCLLSSPANSSVQVQPLPRRWHNSPPVTMSSPTLQSYATNYSCFFTLPDWKY